MSEKTELPSPRRLREAREKGQLPRSRLFSAALVALGGAIAVSAFGPEAVARLLGWTRAVFASGDQVDVAALADQALWVFIVLVAPALGGTLLASFAASLATTGWMFRPALVAPKLDRIDPVAGLGRLVSRRALMDLAKALAVAAAIAWVIQDAIRSDGAEVLSYARGSGAAPLAGALEVVGRALWRGTGVLALLGVADYALARRRHVKDLMMSREELKREHKESEGDPHHKAQRRAAHRQLGQRGPARGVKAATMVVVNPTHLAVAIRYAPDECEAPYLVAKAREEEALALRREAERSGIPVHRDVPLARSLIHFDVGEEIPEELYRAVAALLEAALPRQEGAVR